MTNKEIIFKRLHEAGVDSEPLGPMDFEPQTFADPLAQFEESLKAAGGQSVRLNPGGFERFLELCQRVGEGLRLEVHGTQRLGIDSGLV